MNPHFIPTKGFHSRVGKGKLTIAMNVATPQVSKLTVSPTRRNAFTDHQLVDPPQAAGHELFRATIHEITSPSHRLRRITLHSPSFATYQLSGPDEFFGLLMPQPGTPLHLPQQTKGENLRAAVAEIPAEIRPNLRWYTVRQFDPLNCTLTFDIVTHGITLEDLEVGHDIGPGLRWCLTAQVGSEVGLWTAHGLWHRAAPAQTLIADPSALPSLRAILEYTQTFAPKQLRDMHVIAVAETAEDIEPHLLSEWQEKLGSVELLFCPVAEFTSQTVRLLERIDALEHPARFSQYVWVAGEGDLCKNVRRHCVSTWKLETSAVQWCPYWFLGKARP